ncbi:hypothetical protein [Okeania sp. SIO2B9]|uniref:hypothetical protein n=1 Tax=Okeania sp. SIO2B9 TaxID=2607782 RepID=UPI00142A5BD8|nr:hypothetical protein [Okeania sp. SIO2B9]NES89754.1 hypothetical protein [Okeania sp. SIO2B9]
MIPVSLVNNQRFPGSQGQLKYSQNLPEHQLYQILIVKEQESNSPEPVSDATSPNLGLKTRVFTGTKKQLIEKISEDYISTAYDVFSGIQKLPNEGLNMDNVMPFLDESSDKDRSLFINQYSTVRRLFQARKLSQLIASTWLEGSGDETNSIITPGCEGYVKKLLLRSNHGPDDPQAHTFDRWNERDQMIIMPDQANWQSINLNLLFCGQAYLWKDQKFTRLCQPLLSTYEASQMFTLQVVWENFGGIIEEKSHSGIANPRGPYYKVSIPYPPCPDINDAAGSTTGLTTEKIEKWVKAKDVGYDEELPFVNEIWSAERGINIKFVVPPYPYLPMSCLC